MQDSGNGAGDTCSTGGSGSDISNTSDAGVRYGDGSVMMAETDLAVNSAGIPWSHSKQYNNQLSSSDCGIAGNSILVPDNQYIAKPNNDTLAIVRGVGNSLWFQQEGGSWQGKNGIRATLEHNATTKEYTVATPDGSKFNYYDDDTSHGAQKNQLKSITSPGGHTANITYNPQGRITKYSQIEGVNHVELNYNYGANNKISEVVQTVNSTNVRRSVNTYYGLGASHGNLGDLASSTVEEWDGTTWKQIRKTCYRYYTPTTSGNIGFTHGLKFLISPSSVVAMEKEGLDPLTATDAEVAPYADRYMEYDTSQRVTKVTLNGGLLEYTYAYTTSNLANDYNNWKTKTVETRPDNSTLTVYSNHLNEVILTILAEGNNQWYQYAEFNAQGRAVTMASSDAIASINTPGADDPLTVTLKPNSGLIRIKEYYTTTDPTAGTAANYLHYHGLQQGSSGTVIKLAAYQYTEHSQGTHNTFQVSKETTYLSDIDQTEIAETEYTYTWHTGTLQIQQRTAQLPPVPQEQNGVDDDFFVDAIYDTAGRMTWSRNPLGIISTTSYVETTGAMLQSIQDVDTTTNPAGLPSGWTTPSGAGKNLITDYQSDLQGRTTQALGPEHQIDLNGIATNIRSATFTVYRDDIHETWTAQGYATGSSPSYTTINPVNITKTDAGGRATDNIQAQRSGTGRLTNTDTYPQSSYLRWIQTHYNNQHQITRTRTYFNIPTTGDGTNTINYNQSNYGYDAMNRQNKAVSGGGTITRMIYDVRSLVTETWIGTNDKGATNTDPTGGGASGNNMVRTTTNEYDEGGDKGNGLLTRVIQHADASTDRTTRYGYDWRNRQTSITGEENTYLGTQYNNQDQITLTQQRNGSETATLLTQEQTHYDVQNRPYRTQTYAVDTNGNLGTSLQNNTWYNPAGRIIKQQNAGNQAWIKTLHDSLGRVITTYLSYSSTGTPDGNTNSVANDIVIEQTESDYDNAGNTLATRSYQRYHDTTGNGPLSGPNGANPKARIYHQAQWPDAIGRTQASADYGTNGGNPLARPATIPARTNTTLVTTFTYTPAGEIDTSTDPQGTTNKTHYDDLGRTTRTIENYTGATPTADTDKTTQYTYNNDGQLETLCAKNTTTGDQTTRWQYGTTLTDSQIASTQLLRATIYPDSDDANNPLDNGTDGIYDRIEYQYNRLNQITQQHDQNGTIHQYNYDALGRPVHDNVTTFGPNIDQRIKRISTTYDDHGRINTITSSDSATPGSGTTLNQIQYTYNDYGQLTSDQQAHTGPVTATTPTVHYSYADGSNNTIRPTTITYPDGRQIQLTYGTTGSTDDTLSRISSIDDTAENLQLATYQYLGASTPVTTSYPQPDVQLTYHKQDGEPDGDAGDPYNGLDRFGRIQDQRWLKTTADIERIQYGYTQAGLKQWRQNTTAASGQDDYYTYDGLYQISQRDQGTLNTNKTAISGTPTQQEDFTYDPTGNWDNYTRQANGTTTINQNRTHTQVNEIKTYLGSSHPVQYDKAGNMTTVPASQTNTTDTRQITWDAWNRITRIQTPGTTTSSSSSSSNTPGQQALDVTYQYDGLTRRTRKTTVYGVNPGTVDYYYNLDWKCLEERQGTDTCPERQHIYGIRGRNDLICRDRYHGTSSSSSCSVSHKERHYALNDAMGSITAIVNTTGTILERYSYTAFGESQVLDTNFNNRSLSLYDWQTRFHGEQRDQETGYYNYGYRYYIPELGKWPSRDPIGEEGGYNLYAFVNNWVTRAVDNLGNALVIIDDNGNARPLTGGDASSLPEGAGNVIGGDSVVVDTTPLDINQPIQDHHPIPWDNKTYNHSNHKLVKAACMDLRTQQKLIRLKNHAGPHTKTYHMEVQSRLDVEWQRLGEGRSVAEYRGGVQKVVNSLIDDIQSGDLKLYKNKHVVPFPFEQPGVGKSAIIVPKAKFKTSGGAMSGLTKIMAVVDVWSYVKEFSEHMGKPLIYPEGRPHSTRGGRVYDKQGNYLGESKDVFPDTGYVPGWHNLPGSY